MFGLFGKKELGNGSFNNALIVSLSENLRMLGRLPTEDELFSTIGSLASNSKLSSSQINSVRCCALASGLFANELIPLIKGLQQEIPKGGREYYEKIVSLLSSRAIISSDEAVDFMNKYGLK